MSMGNKMPSGEGYFWTVSLFGAIIIVLVNIGGCAFGGNV